MPRAIALALLSLACSAPAALADGPFEPNETPLEAVTPFAGGQIAAGLETPQDVDFYRIYALAHRQIGVLATLTSSCPSTSGSIGVDVIDADMPGYSSLLGSLRVGWTIDGSRTSNQVTFTSQAGHRYFVRAKPSGCVGGTYTIDVAPASNLTARLVDTQECTAARALAKTARRRYFGLRRAARRRHGSPLARTRAEIQRQQSQVAVDQAATTCRRLPLTGYPFTS